MISVKKDLNSKVKSLIEGYLLVEMKRKEGHMKFENCRTKKSLTEIQKLMLKKISSYDDYINRIDRLILSYTNADIALFFNISIELNFIYYQIFK